MKKLADLRHPMQPVGEDRNGSPRFKENAIVQYLLKHGGIDLNKLACLPFDNAERTHFAQLIGYSTDGFGELSYVDGASYQQAHAIADGEDPKDARIKALEEQLAEAKAGMLAGVAALFEKHPDDFKRDGEE